ncbi:hypothetical protein A3G67_04345 [Candidatus Roizmanbacteria bacterium RIFCSPLOWO2_12_FULL_40_12]|nr:MAG: hypothetical protein A3G67_04345 [Candidatus Roizmanbacteria bacterium RIFCSPLOWO2_12_FULL_40_12]
MEDALVIRGGNTLKGEVVLSGAKNVALKAIIAALLFDSKVVIQNVPRINDVIELVHLITKLGAHAEFTEKNTLEIDSSKLTSNRVDLLHASKIRVSFLLFAPLLHRFKECYIPNPGGCRIGERSIARITKGMRSLGIKVAYDSKNGYYKATMPKLPSGSYKFEKQTHTGTELLILLSVLGNKKIVIDNAALEPEIDWLTSFLNKAGAKIIRKGKRITIEGVEKLVQQKPYRIPSDRNEAVTFAILAIASKGDITVGPISEAVLSSFIDALKETGAGVENLSDNRIRFFYKKEIKPVSIVTDAHPKFMTDWQSTWAVLMTQASGTSTIHERVFEGRFGYVEELKKLGADIEFIDKKVSNPEKFYHFNYQNNRKHRQAIQIKGQQALHNGVLHITDLRAGATLAIASLIVNGESIVEGASTLERGYEDFPEKIRVLGGNIKKV